MRVTPTATPRTGTQITVFVIQWATSIPSGDVYNVKVKGPLDASYQPLLIGTTAGSADFTPDEGIGKYQFRAQLKGPTASSQYSPAATIRVNS